MLNGTYAAEKQLEESPGSTGPRRTARQSSTVARVELSYLAFDVIGDLAYGASFGLLQAQNDSVSISGPTDELGQSDKKATRIPVIAAMASFNLNIVSVAMFPLWMRNIVQLLPWHFSGLLKQIRFFSLVAAQTDARLKRGSDEAQGPDFVDKLLQVRNEDGTGMSVEELRSETSVMLLAGSDTTSNTLSSLCYHLAINPNIQRELQSELDKHLPLAFSDDCDEQADSNISPGDIVPDYNQIKNLPYLNACVKEVLRIHSTIGTGLPRVVPAGKTLTVSGQMFKAGSIVSVPSYTTHRSHVWGSDASEFRPERWLEDSSGTFNKYFVPFSVGTRSCVGRNLAYMNVTLIAAALFHRYSVEALPSTKVGGFYVVMKLADSDPAPNSWWYTRPSSERRHIANLQSNGVMWLERSSAMRR
ncbi:Benzoate 4-monooxygenase [Rhizoctonia solani AG-1 IB]|uniref:Benzoate 4-monooxygenase n=1 Tax=Thanatephorus cucumeris (strain AG1-IB / isolate 7/3/14) TaxID=1108050 RepID=M5C331_THACB|nr:Benzoate 4-monooxygenase [Rhizoctonia solani AG-1 IB]